MTCAYCLQSIIYYAVRSPKLDEWLLNDTIKEGISVARDSNYVDLDPSFSSSVDEDYDTRVGGVTKLAFTGEYMPWIRYCVAKREQAIECDEDSLLTSLCFCLSLLGRRVLNTASHNNGSCRYGLRSQLVPFNAFYCMYEYHGYRKDQLKFLYFCALVQCIIKIYHSALTEHALLTSWSLLCSVDFFLCGLHALFKGDFRITSSRDEWVFADMEMLRRVVAPGVRMSLKLHQVSRTLEVSLG